MTETRENRRARRNQMMKESLSVLHELDKEKIENGIPLLDGYMGGGIDPKVKNSEALADKVIALVKNQSLTDRELGKQVRILIQKHERF